MIRERGLKEEMGFVVDCCFYKKKNINKLKKYIYIYIYI